MRPKAVLALFVSSAVVISGMMLPAVASAEELDPSTSQAPETSLEFSTPESDVENTAPSLTSLELSAEPTSNGTASISLEGNVESVPNSEPAGIYDAETFQTLKICSDLSDCTIDVSLEDHDFLYAQSGSTRSAPIALNGADSTAISQLPTEAPSNLAANWSINLTGPSTFETGEEALLTATAAGDTISLISGYSIYIFDTTNDELVQYEMSSQNAYANAAWTADDKFRTYKAYVAQFSGYTPTVSHVADLTNIQATSADLVVSRADWTLSIEECKDCSYPTINFDANQDTLFSDYQMVLHNLTTDEWVYEGQISWNEFTGSAAFVGYIGVPTYTSPPSTLEINGVTDIQVISNTIIAGTTQNVNGGSNPSEYCPQTCAADPVNTFTGEYWDSIEDLTSITGTTPPLNWLRSYATSRKAIDTGLGLGWNFNYNMYLMEGSVGAPAATGNLTTTGQVDFYQENGSITSFYKMPSGGYATGEGVKASLIYNASLSELTITRDSGERFVFNSNTGKLKKMVDRNGVSLTMTYTSNKLTTVTDSKSGKSLTLTWSGAHITSVTNSASETITYAYTGTKLTGVTDKAGKTWGYTYDTSNRITVKTDPNSKTVTNTYNTANKVTKQVDELGKETKFAYSSATATVPYTRVTAPDNVITEYQYKSGKLSQETINYGQTNKRVFKYEYNGADGRLSKKINPDNTFSLFTYDSKGNLLTSKNELNRVTTTTYNSLNLPLTIVDPAGNTTTFTYDAAGNLTSLTDGENHTTTFIRNSDGTLASTESPLGATVTYTYNAAGLLLTATNDLGQTVDYTRDSRGLPTAIEDALGAVTTYTYDARGNVLVLTDPQNSETTSTYDNLGRLLTLTDDSNHSSSFAYDAKGYPTSSTDALSQVSVIEYDSMHRPIKTTDKRGKVTELTYTVYGELKTTKDPLLQVTEFEYNWRGQVTKTKLPSGKQTTNTYDAAGRLLTQSDYDGNVVTYTYDLAGNVATVKDPENRTYSYSYDGNNKALVTTRPDTKTEENTYDAEGKLATHEDALGNIAVYGYNSVGQMISSNELGVQYSYEYDANGNVNSKINLADNSVIGYTYNSRNLLTSISYNDLTTSDVSYTYDNLGRRTSMTDGTGITSYTYDVLSRITKVENPNGDVSYEYNPNNDVTKLTYPSGLQANYVYDNAGKMTSVATTAVGPITFGYNSDSLPTTTAYPNGVTTTRSYTTNNEVSSISSTKSANQILNYSYEYSDSGLVTKQNSDTSLPDDVRNYSYDSLSRMSTIMNGSTSNGFGFNDVNSLTTNARGATFTQDTSTQHVTDLDASNLNKHIDYTYDARGNRVLSQQTIGILAVNYEYTYNSANRLVEANRASNPPPAPKDWSIGYTYNGNGLLTEREKTVGSNTTTSEYVWNQNTTVPTLLEDENQIYLYGTSAAPLAQMNKTSSILRFLHSDKLGSIRAATSSTGSIISEYLYDEYGNDLAGDTSHSVTKFGYAGEYRDSDTGFYYLRARWYDPSTAQFTSVDPILSKTHSPYGYVGGNPLNQTDPTGLDYSIYSIWASGFTAFFTNHASEGASFAAGAEDSAVGLGYPEYSTTRYTRHGVYDALVDECSDAYTWGTWASVFAPGAGASKGAKAAKGAGKLFRNLEIKNAKHYFDESGLLVSGWYRDQAGNIVSAVRSHDDLLRILDDWIAAGGKDVAPPPGSGYTRSIMMPDKTSINYRPSSSQKGMSDGSPTIDVFIPKEMRADYGGVKNIKNIKIHIDSGGGGA